MPPGFPNPSRLLETISVLGRVADDLKIRKFGTSVPDMPLKVPQSGEGETLGMLIEDMLAEMPGLYRTVSRQVLVEIVLLEPPNRILERRQCRIRIQTE